MTVIHIHKYTSTFIIGIISVFIYSVASNSMHWIWPKVHFFDDIVTEGEAYEQLLWDSLNEIQKHSSAFFSHVPILSISTQMYLNASQRCKCLLARPQSDDVSFHQQTDRQVNQLGVTVRPVKGPWRGRGCIQIRVQWWRPSKFTRTPWQIVW